MNWLRRHRLIAIAVILGIGMMGADALIHLLPYRHGDWLAELSGLQAPELGMLISFLVLPIVFGLYAHSSLQRAQTADETVRDSALFMNALMENVPQIICIKDAGNMRYVHINRSAENLLDCSRDQLIDSSDRDKLLMAPTARH